MREQNCDVAVLGAGPAGLAAAVAAREAGAEKVVVVERDKRPGGILQQCIHPGFGLDYFQEELTGPEYAQRFIDRARELNVEMLLGTMALEIRGRDLICVNPGGLIRLRPGASVLSMGCRERTRGQLAIPGTRPAGVYTAGTAQRLLNIQSQLVGRNIVILGSGDIGMIMARRLTLEGARIEAVVELLPYLSGLMRNRVQCLDDFGIPLLLSHTVVDIGGLDRVSGVTIAPVDDNRQPLMEQSREIACDTLLLSVGLIPENELSRSGGLSLSPVTRGPEVDQFMRTRAPGFFACGNVLHVNDLVDNVSREGAAAGRSAALSAQGRLPGGREVEVRAGEGVRYVSPQRLVPVGGQDVSLFFRVERPLAGKVLLEARSGDRRLVSRQALAVNPGEMESLTLGREDLAGLAEPVTVGVREVTEP